MTDKTKPIHIMLDLETLGRGSDAAIVQVGMKSDTGAKFFMTVDFNDACRAGTVTGDTIAWWMMQSEEARESLVNNKRGVNMEEVVASLTASFLNDFIANNKKDTDIYLWSHASFDVPILESMLSRNGLENPISYRNIRDMRTIEHFYGDKIEWEPRTGIHHDALDDAEYQLKHLLKMLAVAEAEQSGAAPSAKSLACIEKMISRSQKILTNYLVPQGKGKQETLGLLLDVMDDKVSLVELEKLRDYLEGKGIE